MCFNQAPRLLGFAAWVVVVVVVVENIATHSTANILAKVLAARGRRGRRGKKGAADMAGSNFNPKACEFVPGSDTYGPLWGTTRRPGPGWLPAHLAMSGSMPPGPSSSGWSGPMGPCGGGRPLQHMFKNQTDGMGEDESDESPMPAPKGVAAMWNLDPSYTEESLRADLWEVDFEPEEIVSCGKNKGAFGLVFAEKYMATALATALDCIDPEEKVVRSCGNSEDFTELVRVAEWEDEAIPRFVRNAMSKILFAPDAP